MGGERESVSAVSEKIRAREKALVSWLAGLAWLADSDDVRVLRTDM
jgi:hypothetical protein